MLEHSSKLIENWQEFETKIIKVSEITIKKFAHCFLMI